MIRQANAIAEQRAVGERRRRIDGDDPNGRVLGADVPHERRNERRLADTRRTGDTDRVRAARLRIEIVDDVVGELVPVFDERDRTRERTLVPGAHAVRERLPRPFVARQTAGSGSRTPAGCSASPPRARASAKAAASASTTAEPPHTQRAPTLSLRTPPATNPTPNTV